MESKANKTKEVKKKSLKQAIQELLDSGFTINEVAGHLGLKRSEAQRELLG